MENILGNDLFEWVSYYDTQVAHMRASVQGRDLLEDMLRNMLFQMLSALQYMHESLHIAHRDIKVENIMIGLDGRVTLVDFGLCHQEGVRLTEVAGSIKYVAPEMLIHSNDQPVYALHLVRERRVEDIRV